MKIAIPMADGRFSGHFGGAREFLVFEADARSGSARAGRIFPAPEHRPGSLPEWLSAQGMDAVVVEAIGERALVMLADAGIETYLSDGAATPSDLATACLLGRLPRANRDNSRCDGSHHGHNEHNCANH